MRASAPDKESAPNRPPYRRPAPCAVVPHGVRYSEPVTRFRRTPACRSAQRAYRLRDVPWSPLIYRSRCLGGRWSDARDPPARWISAGSGRYSVRQAGPDLFCRAAIARHQRRTSLCGCGSSRESPSRPRLSGVDCVRDLPVNYQRWGRRPGVAPTDLARVGAVASVQHRTEVQARRHLIRCHATRLRVLLGLFGLRATAGAELHIPEVQRRQRRA